MSALEIAGVGLAVAFLIGGILVFLLAASESNECLEWEDKIDE